MVLREKVRRFLGTSQVDYRVNHQIRFPRVFVIDQNGQNLGEMPVEEALRLAEEAGLDLVEVSPKQRPPVCRIMDYGKFKYKQKKKKKKQHNITIKGIRLRPKIGDHDLQMKIKQAREFIESGHKVQITMMFKGRELAHQDVALEVLEKFYAGLEDVARIEREPTLEGRRITMLLSRHSSRTKKPQSPPGGEEKKQ